MSTEKFDSAITNLLYSDCALWYSNTLLRNGVDTEMRSSCYQSGTYGRSQSGFGLNSLLTTFHASPVDAMM